MQRLSFWHQLHQSFQHQQWGLGSNIWILGRHKHAIHNRRITFFTFPVKPASLPLSWWSHVSFVRARILGLILSSSFFLPTWLSSISLPTPWFGSQCFLPGHLPLSSNRFSNSSLHCSPGSNHHRSHRCGNKWRPCWYMQSLMVWWFSS